MPFYEYRPKSGACDLCQGCFVDLQKMSDPAHTECPDCGQACERVIGVPIVSVRGADYRAAANEERRTENLARAVGENNKMREATLKKYATLEGHTHNCALAGCHGLIAQNEARSVSAASGEATSENSSIEAKRFGSLPHLVGAKDRSQN